MEKSLPALHRKVALITGGNTGIGKCIAMEFARHGAAIVIASLPTMETESAMHELRALSEDCLFVETDVRELTSVDKMLRAAISRFSRIDIVVNSAGILGPLGATENTDPVEWARTISVNLIGAYHVCRQVIPLMRSQGGGKIINLAGGGATTPLPFFSSYAASKAAIARFTETLSKELSTSNIQIYAISPGFVMTDMSHTIIRQLNMLCDWEKEYFTKEAGRGGDSPLLAARLAVFLASDKASHLSGKILSAVWDRIDNLQDPSSTASDSIFTLRRIDNKAFYQNGRNSERKQTVDSAAPLKRIAPDVKLGENVTIFDFVNLYGCEIDDGSRIGPFVEIQRGVKIGKFVKVQSHTFICEGVTIEDEVFIGHGVMFINDAYPFSVLQPSDPPVVFQKVLVKKMAAIGSNATILGNVTIGEHAIIGAGAVVTRDVPDRAIVAGNPAKVLRIRDSVRE